MASDWEVVGSGVFLSLSELIDLLDHMRLVGPDGIGGRAPIVVTWRGTAFGIGGVAVVPGDDFVTIALSPASVV